MLLLWCVVAILLLSSDAFARKPSFYRTFECIGGNRCERSARPSDAAGIQSTLQASQHASLPACRLVCSFGAGLWPMPTGPVSTGSSYVAISPQNFQFINVNSLEGPAREFISNAADEFVKNIRLTCGSECNGIDRNVAVYLKVESSSLDLGWETNEGYDLEISTVGTGIHVLISSQTVYGTRHGLETLSQLIASVPASNGTNQLVVLDSATIHDKPVFKHRGLLIDTARNFLPVRDILRTIDGLASTKMNVLHWHATDSQSFPLEIKNLPLMATFGAYGPDKVYSIEDMQTITRYAKSRGVRVILEIDSPSHAGAGWEWGSYRGLGNLAVCVNQQPWRDYCIQPPCGQLNPVNPNTFVVLRDMYRELLKTFGRNGMMHVGGDELFINCWNSSTEVISGMQRLGLGRSSEDFLKIWSDVHNEQSKILNEESEDKTTDKVIVWSSQLTTPDFIENYLNKSKFIVQTWVEADKDLNKKLLDLGYQLIISTKDAWYLDHGFWGVTKYHSWRDAYNNKIPQNPGVLGGEACMWGEYVFGGALDSRVWPRTAAVAERLWTDPVKITTARAEPRLQAHINRLVRRKILPEAISPEWCNQHEGQCL